MQLKLRQTVIRVNSNMTYDLDINQELNNLKDDYESLIEQNNILIQENHHLKNYLKD